MTSVLIPALVSAALLYRFIELSPSVVIPLNISLSSVVLTSLDSWLLRLIPFAKADCNLDPAIEICSEYDMGIEELQEIYYQGERLGISISVSDNCNEINDLLSLYGQDPLVCSISENLFLDSLSYTPHSSGLLKHNSVSEDEVLFDYTPSSTLEGEFSLEISIFTVQKCVTLSGKNCVSDCVNECEDIQIAEEQELVLHNFALELIPGTQIRVKNKRQKIIWVCVSLSAAIALIFLLLFLLRKKCKGLISFPMIKTVNRYPGIDLTADQPSYTNP